ncbi:MAG: 30S ribosomal protein S17 [Candidatus Aureabacteria bacterium]|nr:30S ribosomal protein S17 [Candidatus Auribacterota bacterium]
MTEKNEGRHGKKMRMTGTVVSDKMDKTIVVEVQRLYMHPVFKKTVKAKKTYLVHDEKEQAKPGDVVRVVSSRPLSRKKRWILEGIETAR